MQKFAYPMSAFNYVFRDLGGALQLRIAIPESTVEWLAQFAGDVNQHASTGFTHQEKLVHKQDHRRLFFLLLRIVLPSEANEAIDDVQRAENLKMECVDKQRFEDAASWLQKYNYGLICLSNYVTEDLSVQPEHIQKLFVLLATESRT